MAFKNLPMAHHSLDYNCVTNIYYICYIYIYIHIHTYIYFLPETGESLFSTNTNWPLVYGFYWIFIIHTTVKVAGGEEGEY